MEIRRTKLDKLQRGNPKHKEIQAKMSGRNKGRSEDVRSKERRRNCKRQGGMETVCCCGNGPKRLMKCRRRRK